MANPSITRLQRTSKRFRLLFTALTFLVPLLNLLFWLSFNHLPDGLLAPKGLLAGLPVSPYQDLPPLFLTIGFFVTLIPLGVAVYGFVTLTKLFRLYEKGVVFTCEHVKLFRKLGYLVISWVFANLLFTSLISLVITHGGPSGQLPTLAVEINLSDLSALVMGAIVVLISKVMDEGRRLEDQQMYTV